MALKSRSVDCAFVVATPKKRRKNNSKMEMEAGYEDASVTDIESAIGDDSDVVETSEKRVLDNNRSLEELILSLQATIV